MGMDGKFKDPEQEEKGGIPAAATSKGLFPEGSVGDRSLACQKKGLGVPDVAYVP